MPVSAAGWRIEPPVSVPIDSGASSAGDGGRRTARRSARHPAEVPRVARRAIGRVLGRRAHRELVHVGLAEHDQVGGAQPLGDRRVVGRQPALEHAGTAGRRRPPHGQHVLERERYAGERTEVVAGGPPTVDIGGVIAGRSGGDVQIGVDVTFREGVGRARGPHVPLGDDPVDRGDAIEVGLDDLDGRDVHRAQALGELGGGELGQFHLSPPPTRCAGPRSGPVRHAARQRARPRATATAVARRAG